MFQESLTGGSRVVSCIWTARQTRTKRHLALLYGTQRYRRILIVRHVVTNQSRMSRLTSKHKAHLSDRSSITCFKYTTCRSAQILLTSMKAKASFGHGSIQNTFFKKSWHYKRRNSGNGFLFRYLHIQWLTYSATWILWYGHFTLTYRNFMGPDKFLRQWLW
jgi:hypothetical protein